MATSPKTPAEDVRKTPLALLGQFSLSLVHDLRSPLTVICNVVNVLRNAAPPTPQITECLDMIDDEVQKMNLTLTNLVEIVHGRELKRESVDLKPLLSESAARVDAGGRLKWQMDLGEEPAVVWCDKVRFQQVVDKLFQNAMRAMQGRGEVHVRLRREGADDVIEVRDTGPGVRDDVRSTLFEPFVTTKPSGLGLGLTYCREIMKRHGGAIDLVESSPAGAVFRLTLPARNEKLESRN